MDAVMATQHPARVTPPVFDEIRAVGRKQGFKEGFNEGRLEGARFILLKYGRRRFGRQPGPKQQRSVDGMESLAVLCRLIDRIAVASTWTELLSTSRSIRGRVPPSPNGTNGECVSS